MVAKDLFAWIGNTDLRAANSGSDAGTGPISLAVTQRKFDRVHLLSDHPEATAAAFISWLQSHCDSKVDLHCVELTSPTEFAEIFEAARSTLLQVEADQGTKEGRVFHLSPGTPAMAAVWILLGKTSHPAELIESSLQSGLKTVSFPFDISAEYIPLVSIARDAELTALTRSLPPVVPEFTSIIHRCREMETAIAEARCVAVHDVPVIIQGESGTGKELFARAIHESSTRKGKAFVEVNCGAIPESLFESEFFGHTAGAFTDAKHTKDGYIEQANEGTLFLDEIGEMPLPSQVKLLRALQEGEVRKVGSQKAKKVSFRVIAATNVNLIEAVSIGRFREDLFHRLAVGILHLPPLRERSGDLNLLIDFSINHLNKANEQRDGWVQKKISAGGRNLLHQHRWPGNVRELINTVSRAAIWTAGPMIDVEHIRRAILPPTKSPNDVDNVLNRSIGNGFDLTKVVGEVATHYLKLANEASKTKAEAAELLGFQNATTFTNWLKKYGLEK